MEKKYIINVVGHQLKNKVVATGGTEVTESQLNGNVGDLLAQGFIVEKNNDSESEKETELTLENMTLAELKTFAKDNDLNVGKGLSKEDLYISLQEQIDALSNNDSEKK